MQFAGVHQIQVTSPQGLSTPGNFNSPSVAETLWVWRAWKTYEMHHCYKKCLEKGLPIAILVPSMVADFGPGQFGKSSQSG